MSRILPVLVLLACNGNPTPPPLPPPPTEGPVITPQPETCNLDLATLPFSSAWAAVSEIPENDFAEERTYTGTVTVPAAAGLPLTALSVYGGAATLTNPTDDGITRTVDFEATGTCSGARCEWVEVLVDGVLLQAPTAESVSLESTALFGLDFSLAQSAARVGATGLVPGVRPELDAAVPDVVDAMLTELAATGSAGILSGGVPVIGSATFVAIDAALADATVPSPLLPAVIDQWTLLTTEVPPGAQVAITWGDQKFVPVPADPDGQVAFHFEHAAQEPETYLARTLLADGRQSSVTVFSRGVQNTHQLPMYLEPGQGDTVQVRDAGPGYWVLQRSTSQGGRGACRADDNGNALIAIDPTARFEVLSVQPDTLGISARRSCATADCP